MSDTIASQDRLYTNIVRDLHHVHYDRCVLIFTNTEEQDFHWSICSYARGLSSRDHLVVSDRTFPTMNLAIQDACRMTIKRKTPNLLLYLSFILSYPLSDTHWEALERTADSKYIDEFKRDYRKLWKQAATEIGLPQRSTIPTGEFIRLYHYTPRIRLDDIMKEGIHRGGAEPTENIFFNAVWLSSDPNPDNQEWMIMAPIKREVTLHVDIPREDPRLIKWSDYFKAGRVDKKMYDLLDEFGGGRSNNWYIYIGVVPPEWIREHTLNTDRFYGIDY